MRRPTTILLLIAVGIVAVALVLRSGGETASTSTSAPGATTSSVPGESSTTTAATSTSVAPSATTLPAGVSVCDLYGSVEVVGTVASPDLVEASGMSVSRNHPDVLWAHNDSRGGPILHAFTREGTDLGSFEIPDAFAIDWEDMAAGPDAAGAGSYLYVGDMGDNFGIRGGTITVWRVPDEAPTDLDRAFSASEPFVYQMPDGPFDAEALFVDPIDPALYVITKSRSEAFVFRGSLEGGEGVRPMELVATLFLDAEVSAADISPDGSVIALRGYETVWLWTRDPGRTVADTLSDAPCTGPSPEERQGEAITLEPSYSYLTVSEGTTPDVNYVAADR